MSACLLIGATALHLLNPAFTLSWTHSVEHTEWRESWTVLDNGLRLTEARVKGSGAGMDPGEAAVLQGDWWVWQSDLKVPQLILGASGATEGGWTLCADGECRELGAQSGAPIHLRPCP